MARTTDTDRDHNQQAVLEELVLAIADALGPSFKNGLTPRRAAMLADVRTKLERRTN